MAEMELEELGELEELEPQEPKPKGLVVTMPRLIEPDIGTVARILPETHPNLWLAILGGRCSIVLLPRADLLQTENLNTTTCFATTFSHG
jgi:hypothetical protein